jgi:hypothetical protein
MTQLLTVLMLDLVVVALMAVGDLALLVLEAVQEKLALLLLSR